MCFTVTDAASPIADPVCQLNWNVLVWIGSLVSIQVNLPSFLSTIVICTLQVPLDIMWMMRRMQPSHRPLRYCKYNKLRMVSMQWAWISITSATINHQLNSFSVNWLWFSGMHRNLEIGKHLRVIIGSIRFDLKAVHLPANKIEFSATFAMIAGKVPAYSPRMNPSLRNVSSRQLLIPLYSAGNVCIFTLTVSNGWLTITKATPPNPD